MIIVHSDGYGFTNLDNVTEINVSSRYIHAYSVDGKHNIIGKFESEKDALLALSKLIMECSIGKTKVVALGDK